MRRRCGYECGILGQHRRGGGTGRSHLASGYAYRTGRAQSDQRQRTAVTHRRLDTGAIQRRRSNVIVGFVLAVAWALILGACGGGPGLDEMALGGFEQPGHDYTKSAYQSPNYHPYETGSHVYVWGDTVYLGGDLEPKEALRHVGTDNGISYFMGASRDGVGVGRIRNYEEDLITRDGSGSAFLSSDGFYPFRVKPRVWIHERFSDYPAIAAALEDSIRILNDALPPEFQLKIAGMLTGSLLHEGDIAIALAPPDFLREPCGEEAIACAINDIPFLANYTESALLLIPDDFDTSEYMLPRTVIVHELLHALGIQGHVDSIEFPDSIMGTSGDFFPNPGFTIHRIDREVLQIMYMSQRTEAYNDWGEWSDTSLHLVGRSEDDFTHFGVALFNGLPQPWARGRLPDSDLADNRKLTGRVSWEGLLLGFSGPSPVIGDVKLEVMLSRLADPQDLKFRDIYFVNRFESTGPDRWFPARNLDYKVDIEGNGFWHSSNQGHITGAFLGPEHEGMGGTIKRTDLVGAFGGTR